MHDYANPAQQLSQPGSPYDLPWTAWKSVLFRAYGEMKRDKLSVVAAGCAFFALLSLFPAITAMVVLYGLVADPAQVAEQLETLRDVLPEEAFDIVLHQAQDVAGASSATLSFSLAFAVLLAIWSSGKAARAIMEALNIVYDEEEKRGFILQNLMVVALTLGGIVGILLALGVVALIPALLSIVGQGTALEWLIRLARWPLLAVAVAAGLAVLYRVAPSRRGARWNWIAPGAVIATGLWLIASIVFSIYVARFGTYNETYGSFGAIIILLLWLYLSFFIVLMGGELNAELEHEVAADTTRGPPQPLGRRGAAMADRVAALEADFVAR